MKKIVSILLSSVLVVLALNNLYAKTFGKTEVLKPAPISAATRNFGPFNETPKLIKLGNAEPLAGKQEQIKYYDSASIAQGIYLGLPTPVGPLLDANGDPIISNNGAGSEFDYVGYGMRFSSTLPNPKLDSVKIWFYVDSMENITGNNIEIGCVKQQMITGTDGVDRPFPDLGTTGSIGSSYTANHKTIARSVLKIGTGEVNTRKVSFAGLTLPEQDFIVYMNGRIFIDATTIVTNGITAIGDSINTADTFTDIDPEIHRCYRIALDQESAYYTSGFAIFGDQTAGELYAPNMYMVAYLRDPTAAVDDVKLEGNALAQNYPNPFNPSTEIKYSLANTGKMTLKVYNALGVEVETLFDGTQSAGEHTATFNAGGMPTGTYFYTLQSGSFSQTKRMVLTK
jgi:hypothetical protein